MKQISGTGELVEENLLKIKQLVAHFLCLQSGKSPLWSILLNVIVASKLLIKTWIFKKFSTSDVVLIPGFHPGGPGSTPGMGVVSFGKVTACFPGGLSGVKSACNAGDSGLIPSWEDALKKE